MCVCPDQGNVKIGSSRRSYGDVFRSCFLLLVFVARDVKHIAGLQFRELFNTVIGILDLQRREDNHSHCHLKPLLKCCNRICTPSPFFTYTSAIFLSKLREKGVFVACQNGFGMTQAVVLCVQLEFFPAQLQFRKIV